MKKKKAKKNLCLSLISVNVWISFFVYLKCKETEKLRKRDLSPSGSFPKHLQQLGARQATERSQNSIQVSPLGGRGPGTGATTCCLRGCAATEAGTGSSPGTQTQAFQYGMSVPGNLLPTVPQCPPQNLASTVVISLGFIPLEPSG